MTGPPVFLCDCGAEVEAIELRTGGGHARWIPGAHVEPCRCPPRPRCISCGQVMANAEPHPVCQRVDCALAGVWQVIPDRSPAPPPERPNPTRVTR